MTQISLIYPMNMCSLVFQIVIYLNVGCWQFLFYFINFYWSIFALNVVLVSAVQQSDQLFSSVPQSCPTLQPHELQHDRPPCPSPTTGVHPNPGPLSRLCHPAISSSVVPFTSCPQSFPASGSFQMSQLFASGGQRIGVSASTSVLPMNTKD